MTSGGSGSIEGAANGDSVATKDEAAPDKASAKQTCIGCSLVLVSVAVIIGVIVALCRPAPEPERSRTTPGPITARILTVAPGRPTIRVAIPRKTSHAELRRIAVRMRDGWRGGQGDFGNVRGDRTSRTQQLRFAHTFVFFYLPGMNYERDDAWARVEIAPNGSAQVTIISP